MTKAKGVKKVGTAMDLLTIFNAIEKEKGWTQFQMDSFNTFVENGLQSIINEIGTVDLIPDIGDVKLSFGKVEVGSPYLIESDGYKRSKETKSPLFPNECRIRNLTYAAPIWVNITPIVNGVQEKTERVHVGDLPVMVGSNLAGMLSIRDMIEEQLTACNKQVRYLHDYITGGYS